MKKQKTRVITLLSVAFMLIGQMVFGQEIKNTKAIKLYTNFSWKNTQDTRSFDTTTLTFTVEENKETQIGYFTPAFAIFLPNGNFQEFELSRLQFNHSNSLVNIETDSTGQTSQVVAGQKTTNILVAFRYEYDILLFKNKQESKVQWFTGFSASPYFSNSKFSPIVSTLYPTNENKIGVSLSFIPRINYNVNDRWFIDLNIPIDLFDFNLTVNKDTNPALPDYQKKTATLELSALPSQFLVRLGVGFRL